jgi:hypothetical protein
MQFAPLLILKLFAKNHFSANAIQKNSENFQRMYRFFQRIFISSKEGLIVQKHLIYKKFFLSKRVTCDLKTMSFFRKNKEGKIEVLPQLQSRTVDEDEKKRVDDLANCRVETFSTSKRHASEIGERNGAISILLNEIHSERKALTKSEVQAVVIDSSMNNTMHYLSVMAREVMDVKLKIAPVSFSARWTSTTVDGVSVHPFTSMTNVYNSGEWFDSDVVFLDACGCPVPLISDFEPSIQLLPKKSTGIFGVSWTNGRHMPYMKNVRSSQSMSKRSKSLVKDHGYLRKPLKNNSNKENEQKSYEWMLGFIQFVAKTNGLNLKMYWGGRAGNVRTVIFKSAPLNKPEMHNIVPLKGEAVYVDFWKQIPKSYLMQHDGVLMHDHLLHLIADSRDNLLSLKNQNEKVLSIDKKLDSFVKYIRTICEEMRNSATSTSSAEAEADTTFVESDGSGDGDGDSSGGVVNSSPSQSVLSPPNHNYQLKTMGNLCKKYHKAGHACIAVKATWTNYDSWNIEFCEVEDEKVPACKICFSKKRKTKRKQAQKRKRDEKKCTIVPTNTKNAKR